MRTTLIEMQNSDTDFIIALTQNTSELGGKSYHLHVYRDYGTSRQLVKYRRLRNAEQANRCYMQYRQMGYAVTRRDSFENIEMDMR